MFQPGFSVPCSIHHPAALQARHSVATPKLPGAQPCLASQEGDGERQDVTATPTGRTGLALRPTWIGTVVYNP